MNCEINEIWKPVKGYEEKYEINNKGLIYSHPRMGTKGGYTYGYDDGKGYLTLVVKRNPQINKRVHIMVWETFVGPIPEGYDIHHINHNTKDNRLENLCLIEHKKHIGKHLSERNIKTKSRKVIQFTKDGQFVAEYPSVKEAEKQTNIKQPSISMCCNGVRKTAGGYVWKYKGEE